MVEKKITRRKIIAPLLTAGAALVLYGGIYGLFSKLNVYNLSKEKKAVLIYPVSKGNIEDVVGGLLKLKNAKDSLNKSGVSIGISIDQFSIYNPYHCGVVLKETTEGALEPALRDYFSNVGLPLVIGHGSDWETCNKVLKEYGKKTKIKYHGLVIGRHIVDSKQSVHPSKRIEF